MISELQNSSTLDLIFAIRGGVPTSPYSIFEHVNLLKGLAQAKIIKKSVILFRVLNMTIWCKHVHRLELYIFIIFVLRIHELG